MQSENLSMIQKKIGYKFKNVDLLQQAFVRSSFASEEGGGDNEVLEFIGDKALDFIIVKYLTETYGRFAKDYSDYQEGDWNEFYCDYDEGELTKMKAKLVQKKTLAERIDLLGFGDYLIMGKGDRNKHVEQTDSVKEDLFEAIVGAVALDSNWNTKELEHVVYNMLSPDAILNNSDLENYVELVQKWVLGYSGDLPKYVILDLHDQKDLNKLHSMTERRGIEDRILTYNELENNRNILRGLNLRDKYRYECCLKFSQIEIEFQGFGNSEKVARMEAAKKAFQFLEKKNLLSSIKNEIEKPNLEDAINQLETLSRRGYFRMPDYEYIQEYDHNGNSIWTCQCKIGEYDKVKKASSSSKKKAKKEAAYKMLLCVLDM